MHTGNTRKLERSEWRRYFDEFTRTHCKDNLPEYARVEVYSPTLGAQVVTGNKRLLGFTYDPKDNAFEVAFEGFVHRTFQPREIHVVEGPNGFIESLAITSGKGKVGMSLEKEVVTLRHLPGN